MRTYLVSARSKPSPKGENVGYRVALWTIWVLADLQSEAVAKAKAHIEEAGWIDPQFVVGTPVTREAHITDDKLLSQFDRAQIEGIAATCEKVRPGGQFS